MFYDSRGDRVFVVGGDGGQSATWQLTFDPQPAWTVRPDFLVPAISGDSHGVFDEVNDRLIFINNSMAVSQLRLDAPGGWGTLSPSGTPPPARSFYSVTYDRLRNRLLLFGGGPYTGLFNDVWALSLTGPVIWTQIVGQNVSPAPNPRWGPMCVYDDDFDRLIVFGGSTDTNYSIQNDVWALPLSGAPVWRLILPSGLAPVARMLGTLAFDRSSHRAVLFGGYDGAGLNDTWELTSVGVSSSWNELAPSGTPPAPRWSHGCVVRSLTNEMLVYGGWAANAFGDTWSLDLGTTIGPPVIQSVTPGAGEVGDPVTVSGGRFDGATALSFNGVDAPLLTVSFGSIETRVPLGATSGKLAITTPSGSATSPDSFFVGLRPSLRSFTPDSGKIGQPVTIAGSHLLGVQAVSFGGTGSAAFTVLDDTVLVATVGEASTTGLISARNVIGTGYSPDSFRVVADDPRPHLLSVRDARGDQGGKVVLSWLASDYEQPRHGTISGYRVWRRAPAAVLAAASSNVGESRDLRTARPNRDHTLFWEALADLPAARLEGYAYTAATIRDSLPGDNPYTAFFIEALTMNPAVFYSSNVDSGYSVDDLSPPTPTPFVAEYLPSEVRLHWMPSSAPDFKEFRLYRGPSNTFVPSPSNLIAATTDTTFVDHAASGGTGNVYKLAALDLHDNVSHFAMVSPGGATATLAALVQALWSDGAAQLLWFGSALPALPVSVYRRDDASDWARLAQLYGDGNGYVRYSDASLLPGHEYEYRIGFMDAGVERFAGEAFIRVPAGRLAISAVAPNPVLGTSLGLRLSLADGSPARIRVLDLAGRVVHEGRVAASLTGALTIPLDEGGALRPGVYIVELRQGSQRATRLFTLLR